MPTPWIVAALQVVVGLGLLNVWLLRATSATRFRGGDAESLKSEFAAYGLPEWFFYFVGACKIGAGVSLIAGLWVSALVLPASVLVASLMLGAVAMHLKVKDPPAKSLPALLMLIMAAAIVLLR